VKKALSIFLILFFLASASMSFSEEAKVHQLTGIIQSIDLQGNKVDIKGLRGEIICELIESSKIKISGEVSTASKLKKGDRVVCKYIDDDSGIKCKSITQIEEKKGNK